MTVSIKINGIKELDIAFKKYPKVTQTFMNQAIYAYANETTKLARTAIRTGSRSGRIYSIKGEPHISSSSTEYPARIKEGRGQKGGLHGKIIWKRLKNGAEIISGADYSEYLEFGTPKMKGTQTVKGITFKGGRPYLRPSLKEAEDFFDRNISMALDKAEKEAFAGGFR